MYIRCQYENQNILRSIVDKSDRGHLVHLCSFGLPVGHKLTVFRSIDIHAKSTIEP